MSWMQKLYETYAAGMKLHLPEDKKLMPISHTLQNAHINIVIDGAGNFLRAEALEKTQIILPATEKSAGRTSGEAPHPLADKLQYVAKDYPDFGGSKKTFFDSYRKQLAEWCNSEYSHPKCQAVLRYIDKGHVIHDLVAHSILFVDKTSNKLLTKWPEEYGETPAIFKILPKKDKKTEQGDALVCWTVEIPGVAESTTWNDHELQQGWIDFSAPDEKEGSFCYIRGEEMPLAQSHPAKLRHTGDKAKLLSSNDSSGFTFRGKFTDKTGQQAAGVSYEVTQKAHNALRWLIGNQGYRTGDQVYVSWAVSGQKPPSPLKSSWELFADDNFELEEVSGEQEQEKQQQIDYSVDIGNSFAQKLKRYLGGYGRLLQVNEQIIIMGLDSATPGRMGIIYYRELLASEFLERLESWHEEFSWPQRYTQEIPAPTGKKKPKNRTVWSVSTPAPQRIAKAAYGNILKSNETLYKSIVERILPCIVDGQPFPEDVLLSAVRKCCNRNNVEWWEWEQNLGTTCALYRGYYKRHPDLQQRRNYSMSLEQNNTSRDYLFGRLLAVAEYIEEIALGVAGENRTTNAARIMQRFADQPCSAWRNLELALQPYMQRLQNSRKGFLVNRKKELDEIMSLFRSEDFTADRPLSGEFLLGYHCQKQYWTTTKQEEGETL